MDPEYARIYRRLHAEHWWFRARHRFLFRELWRRSPEGGFGPILDVGCGDGLFLPALERIGEPEGLEPDESIVSDETRRRWPFHLRSFDDAFAAGENRERFGLVGLFDVLEHLDDDAAAARTAFRVLRPGGLFVLTVPALDWLWTHHDDVNHHRRRYARGELRGRLATAGFEVESVRYLFHWLVAAKLAVRWKERLLGPSDLPGVPPEPLNRLLYAACVAEQETLGRLPAPLAPPLGSSLFAVARKP